MNDYYEDGRKYRPIDIINELDLNFNLGNVVKYISRAGRKDTSSRYSDIQKALDYALYELKSITLNDENKNFAHKKILVFSVSDKAVIADWDLTGNLADVLTNIYLIKKTEGLKDRKNIYLYQSLVNSLRNENEEYLHNALQGH